MRVTVDRVACESNGICAGIAPAVFDLGDDDVLRVLDETPGEDARELVQEAVRNCPRQALSLDP
jgi:ferredoxin